MADRNAAAGGHGGKAVVNGAGIAGLVLARLLAERTPAVRAEGYLISFFGPGYDVAKRMGLLPLRKPIAVSKRGRKG